MHSLVEGDVGGFERFPVCKTSIGDACAFGIVCPWNTTAFQTQCVINNLYKLSISF